MQPPYGLHIAVGGEVIFMRPCIVYFLRSDFLRSDFPVLISYTFYRERPRKIYYFIVLYRVLHILTKAPTSARLAREL
jgi:hypothetical protein